MDTQEEIQHLFSQYIAGTITEKDLNRLLQYIDDLPGNNMLKREIQKYISDDPTPLSSPTANEDKIIADAWKVIKNHTKQGKEQKQNSKLWVYAVASCILLVPIIWVLINSQHITGIKPINQKQDDILAGTNRATLILSNGKRYSLDEKQSAITISAKGITYKNGTMVNADPESQQATLAVPNAGQYQVTLADGTKVTLNAASTLKYHTQFTGNERIVQLEGEAYFEVAKNKNKPFKVISKGQVVTVLGTHFNVHAYPNEAIETTLLEGSVTLQNDKNKTSITLKPGEQGTISGSNITVETVNVEDVIAWSNNLFVFNNMPMVEIMKQLERWYNIEVIYPNTLAKERLYAEIPKDRKLSQVLTILEKASALKFKLEGRRLRVSQ
ncbi:fec operon regulator FecR [compost metagenome]